MRNKKSNRCDLMHQAMSQTLTVHTTDHIQNEISVILLAGLLASQCRHNSSSPFSQPPQISFQYKMNVNQSLQYSDTLYIFMCVRIKIFNNNNSSSPLSQPATRYPYSCGFSQLIHFYFQLTFQPTNRYILLNDLLTSQQIYPSK